MSTLKSTIPSVPTKKFLFVDARPDSAVAKSRRRLIATMQDAVRALNSGIERLECTGNCDDTEIDRAWERMLYAVQWFEEERIMDEFEAKMNRQHRRGIIREVA